MENQFRLKWTSHQGTVLSVFDALLSTESLVDVTLACEGQYIRAHKMILSACSPYFQELINVDVNKHPIFFLKDVKYTQLKTLIHYMYRGEVNITGEDLPSLLAVAQALKIRGLAEIETGNNIISCDTIILPDFGTNRVPKPKPPPPAVVPVPAPLAVPVPAPVAVPVPPRPAIVPVPPRPAIVPVPPRPAIVPVPPPAAVPVPPRPAVVPVPPRPAVVPVPPPAAVPVPPRPAVVSVPPPAAVPVPPRPAVVPVPSRLLPVVISAVSSNALRASLQAKEPSVSHQSAPKRTVPTVRPPAAKKSRTRLSSLSKVQKQSQIVDPIDVQSFPRIASAELLDTAETADLPSTSSSHYKSCAGHSQDTNYSESDTEMVDDTDVLLYGPVVMVKLEATGAIVIDLEDEEEENSMIRSSFSESGQLGDGDDTSGVPDDKDGVMANGSGSVNSAGAEDGKDAFGLLWENDGSEEDSDVDDPNDPDWKVEDVRSVSGGTKSVVALAQKKVTVTLKKACQCDHCKQRFSERRSLNRHMQNSCSKFVQRVPKICEFCGSAFMPSSIKKHQRYHCKARKENMETKKPS